MSSRLTTFISSTVKDFAGTRRDLREWMEGRGLVVRLSDHDDFPVDAGVTSHEACLRAIANSHVMILLIGDRYGGRYGGTTQSITWREYDEARQLKIPVIALVLRHVNAEAERWSRSHRMKTRNSKQALARKSKKEPVLTDDTLQVFEFIDAVRKGHSDNWMHLWDGSVTHASEIIRARLNALFVSYQAPHTDLVRRAEALGSYAGARRRLDIATTAVIGKPGFSPSASLDFILALVEEDRTILFGFERDARYNFAVYEHRRGWLHKIARRADPRIRQRNRTWKVGQGHVGLCFEQQKTLVSPDLRHTRSWVAGTPSDRTNYVSAIAVPLSDIRKMTISGVLVITSGTKDHFVDAAQAEVLTAEGLALILGLVGASWQ